MVLYTIQVQHYSDKLQDGKWYDLETTNNQETADKLVRYFGVEEPIPKGIRPEVCRITGSYAGRPVRWIDENGNTSPITLSEPLTKPK